MGVAFTAHKSKQDIDRMVTDRIISTKRREMHYQMWETEKRQKRIKKLILFGAPNSGKSTLFRSFNPITTKNGRGLNNTLTRQQATNHLVHGYIRSSFKPFITDITMPCSQYYGSYDHPSDILHIIRQNCVSAMLTLLEKSQELYDRDAVRYASCFLNMNDETVNAIKVVMHYRDITFLQEVDCLRIKELGKAMHLLWNLDAIQKTSELGGNGYSLPSNMDYFFDKVKDVMTKDYKPTSQDTLKSKIRANRFIEYNYIHRDIQTMIVDVGRPYGIDKGKNWIHRFEDVCAVIFVANLHHYSVLNHWCEDGKSVLYESIDLFGEVCNSRWFRKAELILLLNKDDLFKDALRKQIPLSTCFSWADGWNGPEYNPTQNDDIADKRHFEACYKRAKNFIAERFCRRNQNPYRKVFWHVTCAAETDIMEDLHWDVQNICSSKNMKSGGLV